MYPWPSCNGRTRNAVGMSIWVGLCTRPITFIAPLPTSPLQLSLKSVTNNRWESLAFFIWGAQEKSELAHQNFFGRREAPALCPPLANCFRSSDATATVPKKMDLHTYQPYPPDNIRMCRLSRHILYCVACVWPDILNQVKVDINRRIYSIDVISALKLTALQTYNYRRPALAAKLLPCLMWIIGLIRLLACRFRWN